MRAKINPGDQSWGSILGMPLNTATCIKKIKQVTAPISHAQVKAGKIPDKQTSGPTAQKKNGNPDIAPLQPPALAAIKPWGIKRELVVPDCRGQR